MRWRNPGRSGSLRIALGVGAALVFCLGVLVASAWARAGGPIAWQQTQGPFGGPVQVLATTSAQPQLVLASTATSLYRSLDGGASWERLAAGDGQGWEVRSLVIDSRDPRRLYVAGSAGLWRSRDGGQSWTRVSGAPGWETLYCVALHADSGMLYVAGVGRIYRSTDGGAQWQLGGEGLAGPVWSLAVHPTDAQRLLAGTDAGLFMSDDGGAHWRPAGEGLPQTPVPTVLIHPEHPEQVVVATALGIFQSDDFGDNWTAWAADPTLSLERAGWLQKLNPGSAVSPAAWQALVGEPEAAQPRLATVNLTQPPLSLAVNPQDAAHLLAGTSAGLTASTDGGATWSPTEGGPILAPILALADWSRNRRTLVAVTPSQLYLTSDGGDTWRSLGAWPQPVERGLLAMDPAGEFVLLALPDGRLFRGTARGDLWAQTTLPGAPQQLIIVRGTGSSDAEANLYLLTEPGGLWRSPDWGAHWEQLAAPGVQGRIEALALSAGPPAVLLAAQERALYALDLNAPALAKLSEAEWKRISSLSLDGDVIALMAVDRRPNSLYAATAKGSMYRLVRGKDVWQLAGQEALPEGIALRALSCVPRNRPQPRLLAVVPDGVLYSDDHGASWSLEHSAGLATAQVLQAVADDVDPDVLYLGTWTGGIYRGSVDGPSPAIWLLYGLLLIVAGGAVALGARIQGARAARKELDELERHQGGWDAAISEALVRHQRATPELLPAIPAQVRLHAMYRYVEAHRDLALVLHEEPPRIEPSRDLALAQFNRHWGMLVERMGNAASATPVVAHIVEQLCQLLGFTPFARRSYDGWVGYMVEASSIRLSLPARFPVAFFVEQELNEDSIHGLRTLMLALNAVSFFALLVIVSDGSSRQDRTRELKALVQADAEDLIVLNVHDLGNLYLAADPANRLIEMILQQVDLTVVSPYVTSGPVPENMFFGRDYEVKVIMRTLQDASYAIAGGRKIGKTSILNKVQRLLQRSEAFASYYLDCHGVFDYPTFAEAFRVATQVEMDATHPETMRAALVRLRRLDGLAGKTQVFLLDEVDHIIRYDLEHDGRLLQVWRALSQEGLCRFILCGERHLYRALHDASSPLFNVCRVMRLGYLPPRDVRRIINDPMAEMGISFDDSEALSQEISAMTSGHPNLVQAVCQMLIGEINARSVRLIRREDVAAVRHSERYRDLFFEVIWGNATTLERLISVLMAPCASFTLADAQAALAERGCVRSPAQIEAALQALELIALLQRQGSRYMQGAPSFATLMEEGNLRESLVDGLMGKLQGEAGS